MLHRTILLAPLALAFAGCHLWTTNDQPMPVKDPVITPWKLTCDPAAPKPASPLRRITSREYIHALVDVLPWLETGYTPANFEGAGRPATAGFENDATRQDVSRPLVGDLSDAATRFGRLAAEQASKIPGCQLERACVRSKMLEAAMLLWRHPLEEDELASLGGLFDAVADESGVEAAAGAVTEALLAAPDFLYQLERAPNEGEARVPASGLELATRLSFLLWDSVPDRALLDAATAGELDTTDGLERVAGRMMDDPRFIRALASFHQQWLSSRQRTSIDAFTATPHLPDSLDRELEHFFAEQWPRHPALSELLTTTRFSVDGELAALYGVPAPANGWGPADVDGKDRKGILGLASFLAARTDNWEGSPIKRGHVVRSSLLCGSLAPPPPTLSAQVRKPSDFPAPNRQRYDEATKREPCWACHAAMNVLGYGFEHFDARGAYLAVDHGQPVDATGVVAGSDVDGPFDGEAQLADRLAGSALVRDCYASHWMRFALGRTDDGCETEPVAARFSAAGGDLRQLVLAVATSDAFRFQRAESP